MCKFEQWLSELLGSDEHKTTIHLCMSNIKQLCRIQSSLYRIISWRVDNLSLGVSHIEKLVVNLFLGVSDIEKLVDNLSLGMADIEKLVDNLREMMSNPHPGLEVQVHWLVTILSRHNIFNIHIQYQSFGMFITNTNRHRHDS